MIYSTLGYYSLIFGLFISLPLFFFSIKNFKNQQPLDFKIIIFSFRPRPISYVCNRSILLGAEMDQ